MSDALKPPTEPTESAISAAPAPTASTDSAPPPTSPQPAPVPPRTYSQLPIYVPPPAYAPNSTVPTFIRTLSILLFVGGTLGAAVAWVYKSIVYPRLVVALKARSRLFTLHESAYVKLYNALRSFTGSASIARLGGAEAIEYRRKLREEQAAKAVVSEEEAVSAGDDGKEEEKQSLLAADKAEGEVEDGAEQSTASLPPLPQLLEPVKSSLSNLRTDIKSASPSALSASSAHSSSNPSNLVQPQGTLMRSLVTFNEYLDSETYSASTFHTYRAYGAYGSTGTSTATGERKALQEVTHSFKAEIRSLKGALLNRRNFAVPRAEVATSA
ncbi:peroxisomal membrane anchor protein [Rhodotorula toruloides]|uniref:Peroxisomal membrane anchor protein n=1 Tax=Rhodotorula toruloides TaxID=5286 RepID=A0A511KIW3_RHOTO|nr:peroxisomal membrane anchor protein [Rhodotorula toruloides]